MKLFSWIAVLGGSILLSWPAFYNGYPLVYPDTGTYIQQSLELLGAVDRPPYYALFIVPFHLGKTLWPIPFVQSALICWLLLKACRMAIGESPAWTWFGLLAFLAVGTGLPWVTSQVMPDVFTSVVLLAFTCLLDHGLSLRERVFLLLLFTGSLCVHQSHLIIAVPLLLAVWILHRCRRLVLPPHFFKQIAACVVLCVFAFISYSMALVKRPMVSTMGPIFLLARSLEDGPARAYLVDVCPKPEYFLCTALERIPPTSNEFLWSANTPLKDLYERKGFLGSLAEARAILRGTLRHYLLWQLTASCRDFAKQLVLVRTGDFQFDYRAEDMNVTRVVARHFPDEFRMYLRSREVEGELKLDVLGGIHAALVLVSAIACVALLIRRPLPPALVQFCLLAFVHFAANAFVSGVFSEPLDRYGSRVAWLLPLLTALCWLAPPRRSEDRE